MDSRPRKLLSTVMSWAESSAGDTDRLATSGVIVQRLGSGGHP